MMRVLQDQQRPPPDAVKSSVAEAQSGDSFSSSSSDRKEQQPLPKHSVVNHSSYCDHARDPPRCGGRATQQPSRGGIAIAFPEILFGMLTAADLNGFDDIISWQPHGRSFVIHDKLAFVNTVMPRYFDQTKLPSFQRQLSLYGFVRLTQGCDRGGYYHEYFLRGRPDLCRQMSRKDAKGKAPKGASSSKTEPDFYAMEFCLRHGNDAMKDPPKAPDAVISHEQGEQPQSIFSSPRYSSLTMNELQTISVILSLPYYG